MYVGTPNICKHNSNTTHAQPITQHTVVGVHHVPYIVRVWGWVWSTSYTLSGTSGWRTGTPGMSNHQGDPCVWVIGILHRGVCVGAGVCVGGGLCRWGIVLLSPPPFPTPYTTPAAITTTYLDCARAPPSGWGAAQEKH